MIEIHTLTHLNMLQYTMGVSRGYRMLTRTVFPLRVGRAECFYWTRVLFCSLGAQYTQHEPKHCHVCGVEAGEVGACRRASAVLEYAPDLATGGVS